MAFERSGLQSLRSARPRADGRSRKVIFVAGEVSGDRQGAALARQLRTLDPTLALIGAGGDLMREAGVDVRIHTVHLGCVGFSESIRLLRPWRQAFRELDDLIEREAPDLAVLIDNEGLNTRLAKTLRNYGVPAVFYFAPQVWLWGAWRARRLARLASLILAVFQQEAAVYGRAGGRVEWIGHPLLDATSGRPDSREACRAVGLDPARPIIALLPGSRIHELQRLGPVMLAAVREVRKKHPRLQVLLPLAAPDWSSLIRAQLAASGLEDVVVVQGEHYDLLSRCALAITKSGTSTLELALLGVPHVAVYKISALSYLLARLFARTSHIAMPNILLGRKVVPEFLQSQVTPQNLASAAMSLLDDPEKADAMRLELACVRACLGGAGATARAAAMILSELNGSQEASVGEAREQGHHAADHATSNQPTVNAS
jgi:lipid-A-disaccharide synthase